MIAKQKSIFADSPDGLPPAFGASLGNALGGDVRLRSEDGANLLSAENDSGAGEMRLVEALPGIMVFFNDFRMARCLSTFTAPEDILCIDWCREGRIEQPLPDGSVTYVASGDLKVDDRTHHAVDFVLPTSRYRGVTIAFDLATAPASIARALPGFSADLHSIKRRFCRDGRPFLIRGCKQASHIAAELYEAPQRTRAGYCQLKALEMLLFLDTLEPAEEHGGFAYFPRSRVGRVKEACAHMVADLSVDVTVEEAAKMAGLSLTSFKECFKGVYGTSPAAYVRGARMAQAARLLKATDARIADIAASVGYDSPSKFSVAFKAALDATPREYRQRR